MHGWTTFYWAWWIAFSPFVGMFIARISSGRTIREFIIVTILAPSLIFLLWMTIFGHTAMVQFFDQGVVTVADSVKEFKAELTLFVFLQELPLSHINVHHRHHFGVNFFRHLYGQRLTGYRHHDCRRQN